MKKSIDLENKMYYQTKNARVKYIVPFYWGSFISISHLLEQGYRRIQKDMIKTLNELTGDNSWFIEDSITDDRVWNMKENTVYGGTTKLGTSFLARYITPNKEIEFRNSIIKVREILFFYYEFGVGTCRLVIDYNSEEEVGMEELDDIIRDSELVTQFLELINIFIQIDCKVISEKLHENKIPTSIDEEYFVKLISAESINVEYRKALWEHVVYQFELDKTDPITDDDVALFFPLLNSSQRSGNTDSSLNPYLRSYPGFGTTLILTSNRLDPETDNTTRVLEIAEYYYAATSMLDDIMYDKFTKFSLKRFRTSKISEIQQDLEEIKTLSNLLEVFLLDLKDSMINFNPTSKLVWRTLEKEWYYIPMIESLREKSTILTDKYRELLDELNEKRNATLNNFVKIFTVFAVLGPAFELYAILEDYHFFESISNLSPIILFSIIIGILGIFAAIALFAISKLRQF